MDLIVRTKHAARKVALCIKAVEGSNAPKRKVTSGDADSARGTGKWAGATSDKITTLALQLLCVICVWGPNSDHVPSSSPPGSPAMVRTPTPHGFR
jgi:hypothetical protein